MNLSKSIPTAGLALLLVSSISTATAAEAIIAPAVASQPSPDSEPLLDDLPVLDPADKAPAPSADLVGPGGSASPSQNAMVNLLNILVAKGNLTRQEGNALILQAERDAAVARAQAAEASADPVNEGDVRVTYVPEVVRARIRDEIKDEVLAAARQEKWAVAAATPEWITRFKPLADIRLRYEYQSYPEGNDNTGAFPNFNSINTGSPFDISGNVFSPQYNVDEDRQRARLRARLGFETDLGEGWTGGIRIATGDSNSPVSTNQSLGLASQGQGGNFSKYAIWLDRAFFKFELGDNPDRRLGLMFGRFDNPFFSTDIIFDEDVGFDGLALTGRFQPFKGFTPYVTGSVSPVFNTDLNFSSNQPSKFKSTDKWLYAAQAGFDFQLGKKVEGKFGAAYYNFQDVEGQLSDPYIPLTDKEAGNTDNTRPSFAQKGNTYMALRNIIPSPLNNFGTTQQYQYFGLASPFQVLTLTGRLDFNFWEPYQISLRGEYARNLAFDQMDIESKAVNNRGPLPEAPITPDTTTSDTTTVADDGTTTTSSPSPVGKYEGGDTAWTVNLQFGKSAFEKRGDWNVFLGYKYIESDAVIDGFNDSEFGGGGTNVKGFVVGGSVALSKRVKLGLQWLSAQEIAGPPLKSDTFIIDLSAKF